MKRATRSMIAAACCGLSLAAVTVLAQESGGKMDDGKMMKDDKLMEGGMEKGMMMEMVAYEVTITNMTKGQPLSPPLLATHSPSIHAWQEGEMASKQVEMIAEGGKNKALAMTFEGNKATDVVAGGMADAIMPGQSKTFVVVAKPGDVLSVLTMLSATNDGFTGVSNMKLGGDEKMMSKDLPAYDAGTEDNTETKADVPVPPAMGMGHPATTPAAPVKLHPGITGKADLDKAKMGWDGPVAHISVKMMMMDDGMKEHGGMKEEGGKTGQ